jgi:hypothetical protein
LQAARESSSEEDKVSFHSTNENVLELEKKQNAKFAPASNSSPYNLRCNLNQFFNFSLVGSVPFGLPCIAMTRRTIDLTLRNKQIEMINDKICRVMR